MINDLNDCNLPVFPGTELEPCRDSVCSTDQRGHGEITPHPVKLKLCNISTVHTLDWAAFAGRCPLCVDRSWRWCSLRLHQLHQADRQWSPGKLSDWLVVQKQESAIMLGCCFWAKCSMLTHPCCPHIHFLNKMQQLLQQMLCYKRPAKRSCKRAKLQHKFITLLSRLVGGRSTINVCSKNSDYLQTMCRHCINLPLSSW